MLPLMWYTSRAALFSCEAPRFVWPVIVCVPETAMLFDSELNGHSKMRVKVYRGVGRHGLQRGAVGRLALPDVGRGG